MLIVVLVMRVDIPGVGRLSGRLMMGLIGIEPANRHRRGRLGEDLLDLAHVRGHRMMMVVGVFARAVACGGHVVAMNVVVMDDMGVTFMGVSVVAVALFAIMAGVFGSRFGLLRRPALRLGTARVALAAARKPFGMGVGLGLLGRFLGGLLLDQRLTVGDRDLIVVGMDFVEGQEPVTVAAVVDKRRLQRRLDPRDLGQIDIAAQQFAGRRLEVEFFYAAILEHNDPGFFRVGGIDKHFVGVGQ